MQSFDSLTIFVIKLLNYNIYILLLNNLKNKNCIESQMRKNIFQYFIKSMKINKMIYIYILEIYFKKFLFLIFYQKDIANEYTKKSEK